MATFAVISVSQAAVNIKKAAPVATKKVDKVESATSLLPTVLGLVSSVQALSAQQQQLSADCAPTSDELNTVNDLVKEWAKLSEVTAESAGSGLGGACPDGYGNMVRYGDNDQTCYDTFHSEEDKDSIWEGFPKASSAQKCEEGNSKKCTTVSNIYDIFGRLPFADGEYEQSDYTKSESKKITKLQEKAQRCAPARIAAAKRELYGGFITQTLGSIGQSSGAAGTASVLDTVTALGGSGDIKTMATSVLPSLGSMLDK
jgi:hypothetical protein